MSTLRRPRDRRLIAGVASALADYLKLPPPVVRVIGALLFVLRPRLAIVAYAIGYLAIVDEPVFDP